MWWSVVSKAALRSKKPITETRLSSDVIKRSSATLTNAVWVLWCALKCKWTSVYRGYKYSFVIFNYYKCYESESLFCVYMMLLCPTLSKCVSSLLWGCVPIQGLHTLSELWSAITSLSVLVMHPTNVHSFYLVLECAPLLHFVVSHIPRFITHPKRRNKWITSSGADLIFKCK